MLGAMEQEKGFKGGTQEEASTQIAPSDAGALLSSYQ